MIFEETDEHGAGFSPLEMDFGGDGGFPEPCEFLDYLLHRHHTLDFVDLCVLLNNLGKLARELDDELAFPAWVPAEPNGSELGVAQIPLMAEGKDRLHVEFAGQTRREEFVDVVLVEKRTDDAVDRVRVRTRLRLHQFRERGTHVSV